MSRSAHWGESFGGRKVISHQGPWITPSTRPQVRRSLETGSPFSKATENALNPSDDDPSKRTIGSGELCPRPPSHDSKVSTPFATSMMTISRIPASSGGSKQSSLARCKFVGSGRSGVLPGQWSQRGSTFVEAMANIPLSACFSKRHQGNSSLKVDGPNAIEI